MWENGEMERKIVELYSAAEIDSLRKKRRVWIVVTAVIGALTLGLCIWFCAKTRTQNAPQMLRNTLLTSLIGGWIVITLLHFCVEDCTCAIAHTEAILSGEREPVAGTFAYKKEYTRVKRGVTMRSVPVSGAGRTALLQVYDAKEKRFDPACTHLVYSVHGFVVAYEVEDADL